MNWLEVVIKPGIKERTYINYKASIENILYLVSDDTSLRTLPTT